MAKVAWHDRRRQDHLLRADGLGHPRLHLQQGHLRRAEADRAEDRRRVLRGARQDQGRRQLRAARHRHRRPVGSRHHGLPEHRPELLEGRGRPQGADRRHGEVHRQALYRHLGTDWPSWAPYLADGYQAQNYPDSQNLFSLGRAAIYPAGSWDISTFEKQGGAELKFDAFPPPVPAGASDCYISDHVDIGMGINAKSPNMDAAKTFMSWVASPAFAGIYANALPGFFPLSNAPRSTSRTRSRRPSSAGATAASRRSATRTRSFRAARRIWKTSCGTSARRCSTARMTPEEAGKKLQDGLDSWYKPAK